jgi:sialic acid synthase SpsE
MKIGVRGIGPEYPCYVILEAGLNHGGNFDRAMDMVKVAKDCVADAVKFQKRSMKDLYRADVLANPERESHSLGVYVPLLRDCELTEDQHILLSDKCAELGMDYLCSAWDIPSLNFLERLGVLAHKIPSACFGDKFLACAVAATEKPTIISTGMHELKEIEKMAPFYKQLFGPDRLAVLHCVSSYPTANKDVNLKFMRWLGHTFETDYGYSGHERGIPITVAAVALGASIIERHFTLDRTLPGPDQAASLEPHGCETMIRHIRAVEEALGDEKTFNRGEFMARETIGKALTWALDHAAGEMTMDESFTSTSPGYGIPVYEWEKYAGKILAKDVKAGTLVGAGDFGEPQGGSK